MGFALKWRGFIGIYNNTNDPKQLWKGVNLIRGKGSITTNITSLEVEEETVTGDKNIAEALNSFCKWGSVAFKRIAGKSKHLC